MRVPHNDPSYPRRGYSQTMNAPLFFLHIFALMGFICIALKIGQKALSALLALQMVLGNLFVTKQMTLFGLDITCAEVYTIGAIFTLNLLQTCYGKKTANRAMLISFFLLFFAIVMGELHLRYHPSSHDTMHPSFVALLKNVPRIMIASILCALASQKLDIECFGVLRKKLPFFLSFALASIVSQLFDTLSFSYLALYGIVHSMRDMIVMSYLIKLIVIFSMIPFTFLIKKWLPHDPVQV